MDQQRCFGNYVNEIVIDESAGQYAICFSSEEKTGPV